MTIRDQGFAMLWTAAIHLEVLMCVRGLDVQVSAHLAVPQVDPRVDEVTSSANHEAVNLMVGW